MGGAMNASIKHEQAIFVAAVGQVPPEQWEAYAREACAGEDQLLARVRQLLRAHAANWTPARTRRIRA